MARIWPVGAGFLAEGRDYCRAGCGNAAGCRLQAGGFVMWWQSWCPYCKSHRIERVLRLYHSLCTSFSKQTAVRRLPKHFTTTGIDSDSRKIGGHARIQESQGRLRTGLARGQSLSGFLLFSMVTATPRPRMTVILMSDPKGNDLRPYLSKLPPADSATEVIRPETPAWNAAYPPTFGSART
jgi:hypothetical protein